MADVIGSEATLKKPKTFVLSFFQLVGTTRFHVQTRRRMSRSLTGQVSRFSRSMTVENHAT